VLVELKAVEQRYRAVIDVLDGMSVTDVARRNKVSRQSRARLAPPLCQRRHGGTGRQELEAREPVRAGDRCSQGYAMPKHADSTLKQPAAAHRQQVSR
jgi:hypothetical protein